MTAYHVAMLLRLVPVATLCILAGCASEATPVTAEEYRASLQAICLETSADLDALPEPPELISVDDFASSAADLLSEESERVRRLEAPAELDGDHRAFIRNTDEQAAAWRSIASGAVTAAGVDTTIDNDAFVEATTRIAQLVLGRNDLVDDMETPGCRRGTS